MIWILALVLVTVVLLPMALVVLRGAPYVPTLKQARKDALTLLLKSGLKKGDLVVDLGSGDGSLLIEMAKQGYRAEGYELQPLLWAISSLRLRHAGVRLGASIRLKDFRKTKLPADTRAIFVFTAGPFVQSIASQLLDQEFENSVTVISNGFELPGLALERTEGQLHLYRIEE